MLAGLTTAALGLAGCSSSPAPAAKAASAPPPVLLPTPLATSIETADGAWATVAMGHLNDPFNTFWQLFYRPTEAADWTDEVEPTATATNGGLALASTGGHSLIVGVLPFDLLTFSPLIATTNAGGTWSTGLLPAGLAGAPDVMAAAPGGQAFALVNASTGAEVLASDNDLSSWKTVAKQAALSSSPGGKACGITEVSGLSYRGTDAVVGTACSRPGVVGILAADPNSPSNWRLVGPELPASLDAGTAQVLDLQATKGGGLVALIGVSGAGGTSLVAAWSAADTQGWSLSPALSVGGSETLVSYGAGIGTGTGSGSETGSGGETGSGSGGGGDTGSGSGGGGDTGSGSGLFVLLSGSGAAASDSGAGRILEEVGGPGSAWRRLPPVPAGTATVAQGLEGALDALAVDDTVLTVWTLGPTSSGWAKAQVVTVPIQFGSSS